MLNAICSEGLLWQAMFSEQIEIEESKIDIWRIFFNMILNYPVKNYGRKPHLRSEAADARLFLYPN